jgi:SAM-dependent methyltransferase
VADYISCGLCGDHGRLDGAQEVAQVRCNVRSHSEDCFTIWRCSSCHSLHCKEDVNLSDYYRGYPFKVHQLDYWTRAAYGSYLRRLLRAGLGRNARILDFGCGPGLFVSYLRSHGFSGAVGYDAHFPTYADDKVLLDRYELIIAQDVVEHVDDPRSLLRRLAYSLVPGGLLSVGTPNADQIDLAHPDLHALSLHQPYHRHILSEKTLVSLASEAGLTPLRKYYRYYYDTLYPTVNYRFLQTYVRLAGNLLDVAFEDPHVAVVAKSPQLWFYALFGYLFPPRTEMLIIFQRL